MLNPHSRGSVLDLSQVLEVAYLQIIMKQDDTSTLILHFMILKFLLWSIFDIVNIGYLSILQWKYLTLQQLHFHDIDGHMYFTLKSKGSYSESQQPVGLIQNQLHS